MAPKGRGENGANCSWASLGSVIFTSIILHLCSSFLSRDLSFLQGTVSPNMQRLAQCDSGKVERERERERSTFREVSTLHVHILHAPYFLRPGIIA